DLRLRDVQAEVAEAVDVEHGRMELAVDDLRRRQVETDERGRVDLLAEIVEVDADCQVRGDRGEDVPGVEGARDVLEVVAGVRQRPGGDDRAAVGGDRQQPVVRPDVDAAVARPDRDTPAAAADAGV